MKRPSLLLCAACALIVACGHAPGPAVDKAPVDAGNIDLAEAARYFREFDAMCEQDGGRLWGPSLCGPIVIVDPATRAAVGNRSDSQGVMVAHEDVFVGTLPEDVLIANTAVEWGGTRWTMLIWRSLGGDAPARQRLMAHEAFHRIQPQLGLEVFGEMNAHLDSSDGRFWMQMEWNALQRALMMNGDARRGAVRDALRFRAARHARFPEAPGREIPLELFEGLAEYSGMRLAGYTDDRVVKAVKAKREGETGFVRSFAYVSGPLYGYLLDGSSDDWRGGVTSATDLGSLLAEVFDIDDAAAVEAQRRAVAYDGDALRVAETEREREQSQRRAAWRAALVEGPVLQVDLNAVSSGSFDPNAVFPFDEGQTVFTVRKLIAEWGTLTIEDGAILEDDGAGRASVSLSGAAEDFHSGDGWSLELEEGWSVAPAERAGDVEVRKD